jgi:hypothetical protein
MPWGHSTTTVVISGLVRRIQLSVGVEADCGMGLSDKQRSDNLGART